MSCRVSAHGEPQLETPLALRQIREGYSENGGPATAEVLANMERECERRVAEARAAGAREGEGAGRRQAASELQPVVERLARTIDEVSGMRARLRREAESDLLALSIAIARRILRREIALDPEALHGLALAALEKLQGQEICRVRMHPSHAAAVTAWLRQAGSSVVEVVPDPAREPGTLIFETARGNLDASVESQLREIERGLADRLRRN